MWYGTCMLHALGSGMSVLAPRSLSGASEPEAGCRCVFGTCSSQNEMPVVDMVNCCPLGSARRWLAGTVPRLGRPGSDGVFSCWCGYRKILGAIAMI